MDPAAPYSPQQAQARLLQLVPSPGAAMLVPAITRLGIPDLLGDDTLPLAALAEATGTHVPSLRRILRALVSLGVLEHSEIAGDPDHFRLSPVGQLLRGDHPNTLRETMLFRGAPYHYRAAAEIDHSIRTGDSGFARSYGMNHFEWCEQNPSEAAQFARFMSEGTTNTRDRAILAAYDFTGVQTMADIAGSEGITLATVLKAHPAMRGILFDLPQTAARARRYLAAQGLAERCEVREGSFFDAVPTADLYLLSRIIHDWDDEKSIAILRNIRQAMNPGAKLLIAEHILPTNFTNGAYPLADITMLVMNGSMERTKDEYRNLLGQAGLTLSRVIPCMPGLDLMEADSA